MQSVAHPWASRNCTVPGCGMRTPPSALKTSYLCSKSKPSVSSCVTNTLTLADSPESVWILTDPTLQYACVLPFMVVILMLQMWHSLALTIVWEQPASRSAKLGIWSICTWMTGCALFTSCPALTSCPLTCFPRQLEAMCPIAPH